MINLDFLYLWCILHENFRFLHIIYIFREMSEISIVKCDSKSEETDIEYYNKETLLLSSFYYNIYNPWRSIIFYSDIKILIWLLLVISSDPESFVLSIRSESEFNDFKPRLYSPKTGFNLAPVQILKNLIQI